MKPTSGSQLPVCFEQPRSFQVIRRPTASTHALRRRRGASHAPKTGPTGSYAPVSAENSGWFYMCHNQVPQVPTQPALTLTVRPFPRKNPTGTKNSA